MPQRRFQTPYNKRRITNAVQQTPYNKRRVCPSGSSLPATLQQFLQSLSVPAAGREPRAALEDDDVVALEERLELADLVDAHDGRAVDAHEVAGIELCLERSHRLAQQVLLTAGVQAHVIR